jgi:hypothetical protein
MRRTHGAPCWLLVLACLGLARGGRCTASPFPVPASDDWQAEFGRPVSAAEAAELREEVREMVCLPVLSGREELALTLPRHPQFTFTYDNYMRHAFPQDELRPLSCGGAVRAVSLHV